MGRIRSVHPGLFTDEAFMGLSAHARVLLIGLWTECDDQGAFEWKPLTLKARLLPVDLVDVAALLAELAASGVVRGYTLGGKQYGLVRNFGRFQRPRKPKASFPIPAELHSFVALGADGDEPDEGQTVPVQKKSEPAVSEGAGVPQKSELVPPKSEKPPQMEDGEGGGKREKEAAQPLGKVEEPRARPLDMDLDAIGERLLAVAKPGTWPLAICASLAPIPKLLAEGCDLDLDIVPTVATIADSARRAGKKIGSWSYFENAIVEARDRRLAGKRSASAGPPTARFPGTPDDWPVQFQATPETVFDLWQQGLWFDAWGRKPGELDCLIPQRIQDEWLARKRGVAA